MKGDYRAMINRRNTLSNRGGKFVIVKLEAEREARHLDYARQITEASISREEKEMRSKMEHLKHLMETNKAQKGSLQVTEEKADKLNSFRRDGLRQDHRKFPKGKMASVLFNKSFGELEETHIKRKLAEKNKLLKMLHEQSRGNTPHSGFYQESSLKTQVITLPEIQPTGIRNKNEFQLKRRISLSNLIASGEIKTLQGFKNESLSQTFPLSSKETGQLGKITQGRRGRSSIKLPPNVVPTKYQKEFLKHNPFITSDFAPKVSRSRALLDSKKSDEMYAWLGFGSVDQFEKKKFEDPHENKVFSNKRILEERMPALIEIDVVSDKVDVVSDKVDAVGDKTEIVGNVNVKENNEKPKESKESLVSIEPDEKETDKSRNDSVKDGEEEMTEKPETRDQDCDIVKNESKIDDNEMVEDDKNMTESDDNPQVGLTHKEDITKDIPMKNVVHTQRPSFKKTDSKLGRETLKLGTPMAVFIPELVATHQRKPLKKFAAAARAVLIVRQFQMN